MTRTAAIYCIESCSSFSLYITFAVPRYSQVCRPSRSRTIMSQPVSSSSCYCSMPMPWPRLTAYSANARIQLLQCWTRLVRFIAQEDGREYYGQPTCSPDTDVGQLFLSGRYDTSSFPSLVYPSPLASFLAITYYILSCRPLSPLMMINRAENHEY